MVGPSDSRGVARLMTGAVGAGASVTESISVHDHSCLIYDSTEEQFAAVVPFMRHGLEAGQRCVYIADDNTVGAVSAAMNDDGIAVDAEIARGALQIITKQESYLRNGNFDPRGMIGLLTEATAAAKADGYDALRVTGEMTWVLGGEPGTERVFEYEAEVNRFFPDHDVLAICQYARRRFEPEAVLNVIRTHQSVICEGVLCENPYYVPPDEFLRPGQAAREVDRLLGSLVEAEHARLALAQAARHWSATFDAMSDAVALLDLRGTVVRCNRAMVELVGRDRDEIIGGTCHELVHGRPTFVEGCPYQRMLRTGMRESFEMSLGERWFQETADPLFGEAEELVGAVHVVRDVTERREAEEALADKTRRLASINTLAIDLASLPSEADLGELLATTLRDTTGAIASALSLYDDSRHMLVSDAVVLAPGIKARIARPLLKRLKGTAVTVTEEMRRQMLREVVDPESASIDTKTSGVPRAVGAVIPRLLGTDRFIALSYVAEGKLYGASLIALTKEAPEPPKEFLESFSHMAAVALRRRKAEQDLNRAGAYNRSLIEASVDPFVTIGPDGAITDVNEATVTVTGRSRAELIGTDFADCFTDPARARAGYEQVFREGAARDLPLRIRHRDGHATEVLYNASTYRDPEGQVAGVFAAARDIGELRRAEREIRHLNDRLERRVAERTRELAAASRELQEFVYSVSHDLRTPLRAIDGFSRSILDDYADVFDERALDDLQRVRAAAQRMGQLIDALLSLARLGHGSTTVSEVDISAAARRAGDELARDDPDRVVELTIQDGLMAETDKALVEIVLECLLGNAWKFSRARSVAHIAFGAETLEGRLVFTVRDDGCGFDPAYADKLFRPFERLHAAEDYPGPGIGLATVARILDRMGGDYWAEGRPGEGATFFFTLAGPGGRPDAGSDDGADGVEDEP